MRQLVLPLPLIFSGHASGRAPQPPANAESELRATERAWLETYDTNDVEAMQRIVADEFEIVYESGAVVDKTTIGFLTPGQPTYPTTRQYTEDTRVRIYGDMAILTGIFVSERPEATNRSRYTDTWIWREGRWQGAASHHTRLPEAP